MTSTDRLSLALADRYRIERELGAGGMATVFLAHDVKHDRKVALKVLKPELAAVLGAERFVVEIKTTASLQHPHILPLFDSGSADGFLYYVMPFIEGETLRDKLSRETQLGVSDAVRITLEVADALDYAHRRGVIHRDIKPENILLHDGRPVVADFGIALAVSAAAGGRMTETGLSLGTPHYMSPEQATADKEITGRSDIYSLASVLYEMLAGQPPHLGGSAQQVIMKIIAEPVDNVTRYRKSVPLNVAAALGKALEKLPADRFSSAKEFADALRNPAFVTGSGTAATTVAQSRAVAAQRVMLAAPLALLAIVTALGVWGWLRPMPSSSAKTLRYVDAIAGEHLRLTPFRDVVLSPEGDRMAMVTGLTSRTSSIIVRDRNQLRVTTVPGSESSIWPAFSPDGTRLLFLESQGPGGFGAGILKVASLDGGATHTVATNVTGGGHWETDGFIYFLTAGSSVFSRVREGGGAVSQFTALDTAAGETYHRAARSLFDGRRMLFIAGTRDDGPQVAIADLTTGKHRRIGLRAALAWYVSSGHIVYLVQGGSLMAARFDYARGTVVGEPELVLEGLAPGFAPDVDISRSGTLIYVSTGSSQGSDELVWLNRDGTPIPTPAWNADFSDLALSPDGSNVVVGIRQRSISELWAQDVGTGSKSRITFEADGSSSQPAWTPDGKSVVFDHTLDGKHAIHKRRADGSTAAETLLTLQHDVSGLAWTPDGTELIVEARRSGSNLDILKFFPGGDTVLRPLLDTRFNEVAPAVSPNGNWLAYVSNESGASEVYVRPFKDIAAARIKASIDGGLQPQWSRTGNELYYIRHSEGGGAQTDSGEVRSSMMVATVKPQATFSAGTPRALFTTRGPIAYWGQTPDGKRFVIVRSVSLQTARPEVVVVENWLRELKR